MAERNRRGRGASDEYGDYGDHDDEDVTDPDDDVVEPRGGGTAIKARPAGRAGFGFGRLGRFIREVVAELRKVIWPTRKELVTYATVVIFFIAVMMAIIATFDYGFGRIIMQVFGN